MTTKPREKESLFFEKSRIRLTNAENHPEIKSRLSEYGMGKEQIKEGWGIYESAKSIWEKNKQEDTETRVASSSYKAAYSQMQELYDRHRDQARIYFKKQPELLVKLGVTGNFPTKYHEFFDKTKQFYQGIKEDMELQQAMNRIKIGSKVVAECLKTHQELLDKRAEYEKELGESQDATKSKNMAIIELKDWMEDFDSVAQVALYDNPQLLETLGIFVRS